MSKKNFLELLIKSFGLTPIEVSHYRTDSSGGQFQSVIGWKVIAADTNGKCAISVHTPEGFEDAVNDVTAQAKNFWQMLEDQTSDDDSGWIHCPNCGRVKSDI